MNKIALKKGEIIFRQGDASTCMYDVFWGKVGIYANYGTPEEKLLTTLETEQFFGEMGMIEGLPRSATAVALTSDTKVLVITPESFQSYFQERPVKVLLIMQNMGRRLRELTEAYMEACQAVAKGAEAEEKGGEIDTEIWNNLEKLSQVYMAYSDVCRQYDGGF